MVEIGVAVAGDALLPWLEWAAERFAASPAGRGVSVHLVPMSSLAGARAVVGGDRRLHVWIPESALYADAAAGEWRQRHGTEPFLRAEPLALTPLVIAVWGERRRVLAERYGELSIDALSAAADEPAGWPGIAGRPEWGLLSLGHPAPDRCDDGVLTLLTLACAYRNEGRELTVDDVLDPGFRAFLGRLEANVFGLSASSGELLADMVAGGPEAYDAVIVPERLVIERLTAAAAAAAGDGRWGGLEVVYPAPTAWNDHPFYLLDVPWSGAAERRAAEALLDFLLAPAAQARLLGHGLRPADPELPLGGPDSPFTRYAGAGLRARRPGVCAVPPAPVTNNLLAVWRRR